jgi:hypothetical protein
VADDQVFEEICTPQLYRDCLVSDANKLLYGPRRGIDSEKPELLSKIKTLRIYHSNTRKGASYADLVSGKCRWKDIGFSREIIPKISAEWVDITALEYHQDEIAGNRFQQGPRLRAGIFGSLERICMTTTGDQSWGTHLQHHIVDQYFGHAWLPTALLNLPTAQHYCQSSMLGPLAIPNMGYRPTYPPKIVTFHYPHPYGFWDPNKRPPIVFGSINRFMSPNPFVLHIPDGGNMRMVGGLREVFSPLLNMLDFFEPVSFQTGDEIHSQYLDNESQIDPTITGTILEVYNFIDLRGRGSSAKNLAKLQKVLDTVLGPWTGKVILKEKSDCPPCSACGYAYK